MSAHTEKVPRVEQRSNHDCGAAALEAVAGRFGRAIKRVPTSEKDGITPEALADAARERGFEATVYDRANRKQIAHALASGMAVILDIQAPEDEANGWSNGHYVVATHMSPASGAVRFMDPSIGDYRSIQGADLERRWHDEDRGKRRRGTMLIVKPMKAT